MAGERLRRVGAWRADGDGFSLAELIVVIAVIGALAVLGMPTFISYWRSATLRAGAQEVVAMLNSGRQLAIRENRSVCIRDDDDAADTYRTKIRYTVGSCLVSSSTTYCDPAGGTTTNCVWRGAGTDGAGYMTFSNRMEVEAATDVVFTYLGAAAPGGTFFVRHPDNTGACASLAVAASGRITTTYQSSGC